ncbi:DNA adenine methylase [Cellvibrio sp. OA-2007]|uniref:DNA adenine methylase n=1 Tax=Cellvibrio sp. OA-2007 TaxID=529823 RepID=UPI000785ECE2|nr:Dam family site-specific DNA-(adenine-N6)-methyltransferase [Cellvibrio sp. OA-2007]
MRRLEAIQTTIPELPSYRSLEKSAYIKGVPGATSVIRWAGSKRRLLPALLEAKPNTYKTYFEPFAGSAAYFLSLSPKGAILSDINTDLIHLYKAIKNHPKKLWDAVCQMPSAESFYYELRSLNPDTLSSLEKAARFWYLNRYCFNGVFRTNLEGQFNVSRGLGNLGIPEFELIKAFSNRLKGVEVLCSNFEPIIDVATKDDFIYLDPPYLDRNKRDRGEYGSGNFDDSHLDRLLESMQRATRRGVKILLSYRCDEHVIGKLPGWNVKNVSVVRSVSSDTTQRTKVGELLIKNY